MNKFKLLSTLLVLLVLGAVFVVGCKVPSAGILLKPDKIERQGSGLLYKIETHEVSRPSLPKAKEEQLIAALEEKYQELEKTNAPIIIEQTQEYTNQVLELEAQILERAMILHPNVEIEKKKTDIIIERESKQKEKEEESRIAFFSQLILFYMILSALMLLGWLVWKYLDKRNAGKK